MNWGEGEAQTFSSLQPLMSKRQDQELNLRESSISELLINTSPHCFLTQHLLWLWNVTILLKADLAFNLHLMADLA